MAIPTNFSRVLGKFPECQRMFQKIFFGKLKKFLGKSAKFLKRLNYYPNEISDDPSEVWQTKALKRFSLKS